MIKSKSGLAVVLSKLEDFKEHDVGLEQYSTPSEISADILWQAYMKGDVAGKVIVDAASGPGFFGLGALLLGAKKVFLVDISKKALDIARRNYKFLVEKYGIGGAVFVEKKIEDFIEKVDVVIQNPPFGTKKKHHDKVFLEKAFSVGDVVYSVHKITSKNFIEALAQDCGFKVDYIAERDFLLRKTQEFHRKEKYYVKVGIWRLVRL